MKILLHPNPILYEPSKECLLLDFPMVLEQVKQMTELLEQVQGLGLAAPQVGIKKRFFIMRTVEDETCNEKGGIITIINPRILNAYEEIESEEGCLSLPGCQVKVKRYAYIEVTFRDHLWNEKHGVFTEPESIIFQHEFDHLVGKTLISGLSRIKKDIYVKKIKKYKRLHGL
jgi:peptide deformylase